MQGGHSQIKKNQGNSMENSWEEESNGSRKGGRESNNGNGHDKNIAHKNIIKSVI